MNSGALDGTCHQNAAFGHATGEGISDTSIGATREGSTPYGFFQTGHRGVLGWLPTDGLQVTEMGTGPSYDKVNPMLASPPEVEVMKIILPKAYKTKYYYRMFITETVYFREPIVNFGITNDSGYAYRPLDVFHIPSSPVAITPSLPSSSSFPNDSETGGNYGDD